MAGVCVCVCITGVRLWVSKNEILFKLAGITAPSPPPCKSRCRSSGWKGRTSSSPPSSAPKTMEVASARQQLTALWRSWRRTTSTSSSSTGRACRGWTWPAPPTPPWGRRAGGRWRKTSRLASFVQLGSPTIPWTICTSCLRSAMWCLMFCKWNSTQSKSISHFGCLVNSHHASSILIQRYQQLEVVKLCKEHGIHLQVKKYTFYHMIISLSDQCNPPIFQQQYAFSIRMDAIQPFLHRPFCGSGLLQPWSRCRWTSAYFPPGCQGAFLQPFGASFIQLLEGPIPPPLSSFHLQVAQKCSKTPAQVLLR